MPDIHRITPNVIRKSRTRAELLASDPNLIDTAEAAQMLGVAMKNVWRYTQLGYLPAVWVATGQGVGPSLYDRRVVELLAALRAEAHDAARYLRVADGPVAEVAELARVIAEERTEAPA